MAVPDCNHTAVVGSAQAGALRSHNLAAVVLYERVVSIVLSLRVETRGRLLTQHSSAEVELRNLRRGGRIVVEELRNYPHCEAGRPGSFDLESRTCLWCRGGVLKGG